MKAIPEFAAFNSLLFDTTLDLEESAGLTFENWRVPATS